MTHRMIVGFVVLLLLVACGGAAGTSTGTAGEAAQTAASVAPAQAGQAGGATDTGASGSGTSAGGGDKQSTGQQPQNTQNAQNQRERLVIRTASIRLLVEKVDEAEAQVRQLAESRGGFVISLQTTGEDDRRTATITFKVPANRFDDAISELNDLAIKVEAREVKGEDVTDQFVDLESRLRNLRAVETRMLEFLQQANTITESLAVSEQLTDVQGQIEQTQGRMTFLSESAALSTITVSLHTREVVQVVPDEGWSAVTTARAATNNLLSFGQVLADIAIVFAVWMPVWLPPLIVALWWRRRQRRVPTPTP